MSLYPLLLISALALAAPIALHRIRRVRIPVIVGEILCGILVGRSGFDLVQPNQWLDFLSLLGFAYLMFLGGMELDFSIVAGRGRRISGNAPRTLFSPLVLAVLIFAGNLGLSYSLGIFLIRGAWVGSETHPVIFALLLGTTSVGVILPVLKESGLMQRPYGQTLMLAAVFADFATITLATVALIMLGGKSGGFEILTVVVLGIVFYLIYSAGSRVIRNPLIRRFYMELSNTSAQLRVRTAFALMLLFAVISQVMGVEVILGAFIAGAIFSALFQSESWEEEIKFDAIGYGFFIPVFFIMVGVRLDLSQLWSAGQNVLLLVLLIAGAFAVKIVPSLILAFKYGARQAVAGGFLLAGQLSLLIAFAQVAVQAGLLSPALEPICIAIAIVTCMVSPLVFLRLIPQEDAGGQRVGIVILGAGKVGRLLARRFHERGHSVSILDHDPAAVARASRLGLEAFLCQTIDAPTLKRAHASSAHTFVAVTNQDPVNLDACLAARAEFGIKSLIARVGNPANSAEFLRHGIQPMNTTMASVVTLENLIYRPNVFRVLSHDDSRNEVVEIIVTNPQIAGRRISQIPIPEQALILMVRKGEITSVPHGNTRLDPGDTITLFVHAESLPEIVRLFDPDRPDHHTSAPHDAL